jgi:hypothetical protein
VAPALLALVAATRVSWREWGDPIFGEFAAAVRA